MDSSKDFPAQGSRPANVLYKVELCDPKGNTIQLLEGVPILKVSAMMEIMKTGQYILISEC